MTSSGKSVSDFLAAKDRRQEILTRILSERYPATIFLSLNIPGEEKTLPGAEALCDWALGELSNNFPGLLMRGKACDLLGPYAIMALDTDPVATKECCMLIESRHPAARLVDLDVYSGMGIQIDRGCLGLPARACLVCRQPAVECMRLKRHSLAEVTGKADELLAHFRT